MEAKRTFRGCTIALTPLLCLFVLAAGCGGSLTQREDRLRRALKADELDAQREAADDALAADELGRASLVHAVLARNPTLAAMREANRATVERSRSAAAPPAPMVEYAIAPLSIGSQHRFGQSIQIRQPLPFPGKLALDREVALSEAEASREDYEAARAELAQTASSLFDAYRSVTRSLAVNETHARLVESMAALAEANVGAGRAPQDDLFAAELEKANVARERLRLETERDVLVAQLNGLLRRDPRKPLPPPAEHDELNGTNLGDGEALVEEALAGRAELRAIEARLAGKRAFVRRSERDAFPDFALMGEYNSMWMDAPHRFMVGVAIEVPIFQGFRRAATRSAEAEAASVEEERTSRTTAILVEVERARIEVEASERTIALVRERILPPARARLESAQIAYQAGRGPFASVVEAERALRNAELDAELLRAEHARRLADLARALGRSPLDLLATGEEQ